MVLEATMLCIDNSEYQRNGDYPPSRMQAQQDAANLILQCKLRANPESAVGVLAMADKVDVLSTLTQDNGKLFMQLHRTQPHGLCNFLAGMRVAALALKHRQNRNQRMRIVVFVGSPLGEDVTQQELVRIGKKLKKDKINVDVVCFGAEANEQRHIESLTAFVDTINGGAAEAGESHLVSVPTNVTMPEVLLSSAVCRSADGTAPSGLGAGGGGGGGVADFGFDPSDDPELAMALRVSLEEQRQADQPAAVSDGAIGVSAPVAAAEANFEAMTEEEQMQWALRMSMMAAGNDEDMTGESADQPNADMDDITDPQTLARIIGDITGQANAAPPPASGSTESPKEEEKKD